MVDTSHIKSEREFVEARSPLLEKIGFSRIVKLLRLPWSPDQIKKLLCW